MIGTLVREVLKVHEYMSHMMAKLVVMELKMESQRQLAAETQANPELLLEPLQEMVQLRSISWSLNFGGIFT